ncbi:MAG: hypothetical protein SH850_09235 [Planctomycetaceae bacterium]|nr:hypothetical protein [Planctomycetaceae bacterium]
MTTKAALIATVSIMIGAIILGLSALFAFIDPTAQNANERAALLGQGMGLLCMIPLGGVWILWAARFRKERERRNRQ